MTHSKKPSIKFARERRTNVTVKQARCQFCGKTFKSRSHFDALCNFCWAENDMRADWNLDGFKRSNVAN